MEVFLNSDLKDDFYKCSLVIYCELTKLLNVNKFCVKDF